MRNGDNLLKSKLGQAITDGIFQSYFFNKNLSDKINVTYLKFDKWLHLSTTDGTAILELEVDYPKQIESWTNEENSTSSFTLTKIENEFPRFKEYIGQKLIKYSELVLLDSVSITCGLKFYFENDLFLILYSDNDEKSYYSFDNIIPEFLKEKG